VTNTVKFRGDGDTVLVDIGAGVGAQEVFTVSTINEDINNGEFWTFSTTERDYHVWYSTIDGDPQDPANPFLGNLSSIGLPVTFASVTPTAEVTRIVFPDMDTNIESGTGASADFFQLRGVDDSFYVWFLASDADTGAVTVDPTTDGSGTAVPAGPLASGELAADVASAVATAINALDAFSATASAAAVTITGASAGAVTAFPTSLAAASNVTGSVTVSQDNQGIDAAGAELVATATRDALNRLGGEVFASLVNNSTIQVAVKKFGAVTNAADGTAGVTVGVDTAGVSRSTIIADHIIYGSDGNVVSLVAGTDLLDLEGSTYEIVSVNDISACGAQVVASAGDTPVKSDNLVLTATDLGGLGSSIGGVS
jgi:hypothetical protein